MELPVIVPSHKRAGQVTTLKHVPWAKLCVPESQKDEYVNAYGAESVIVHPDSVRGLPAKRQWILENLSNEHGVIMLDDDVIACFRLWRLKGHGKDGLYEALLTPDEIKVLFDRTSDTCKELGAYLFGWNAHSHPMTYRPGRPFGFGGYIPGGAFGVLRGSKLYWPNVFLPIDDYWICLLNAYHHRYCLIDKRFAFGFRGTYTAPGGCTEMRINDGEQRATEYLVKHFGNAVVSKKPTGTATKRQKNRAARAIRLPWPH